MTKLTKKKNEVAFTNEYDTDCASSSDILIPKILLMQGQSEMVLAGEAAFAEYRDSVTKEKLGDTKSPVQILPFYMFKTWVVSKKEGERWTFHAIEDYDPKHIHEWTEVRDGEHFKYEETINFYCFTRKKPDDEVGGIISTLPIVVSFKSTSKRAGQTIYTQMYVINKAKRLLPFNTWFDLKSVKESKNGNTYAKSAVSVSQRSVTPFEIEQCQQWFSIVKQNTGFQVDSGEHSASSKPDVSDVSF